MDVTALLSALGSGSDETRAHAENEYLSQLRSNPAKVRASSLGAAGDPNTASTRIARIAMSYWCAAQVVEALLHQLWENEDAAIRSYAAVYARLAFRGDDVWPRMDESQQQAGALVLVDSCNGAPRNCINAVFSLAR